MVDDVLKLIREILETNLIWTGFQKSAIRRAFDLQLGRITHSHSLIFVTRFIGQISTK